MKNNILAIVAIVALLSSCTVEKRHYMSGYHVDWHTRTAKADKNKQNNSEEANANEIAYVESQNATEESSEVAIEIKNEIVFETSAVEPVAVPEQSSKQAATEERKAEKNLID
ncbi:MAG: hypothetical protein R2809_10115 [Flavobacteriales bacterium]